MILLTDEPIDVEATTRIVQSDQAGAVVTFLGTTREFTRDRQTVRLAYEAHAEMAEHKLQELREVACKRWSLVECAIVHRLGVVELGEASVLVAVSSAHRKAAFEAAEWIMNTLKQEVPIWKQEHWADGTQEWVHPGVAEGSTKSNEP